MALDIAVIALVVAAVGVPIAGIGIILTIYFKINDRVNEMLRISSQDKFEIATEIKTLERDIKTVDTTFRKYAEDMSAYLNGQFQAVSNDIKALQHQINNHSGVLNSQGQQIERLINLIGSLQGLVQEQMNRNVQ